MRILMTADAVGGVWTYAMELATALEPHGVEILLATMGAAPKPDQRAEALARSNVRLADSTYKLEWMQDPWPDVDRAGDWLLDLAREYGPDVVHLNGYAHAALPWSVPTIVVAHSCVRSWWRAVKGSDVPELWADYTRRVRAGLDAADLVIAPTRAMLDALHEEYGQIGASEVIPNGRALPPMASVAKSNLVFSAGRTWDEAKNIGALARVARRLRWPVAIAGDIESPNGSAISSGGGACWLGRLTAEQTASWMARSSIFALPARYEPFGLSALEAALCGCALVLGRIESLREVWGDAAVYVDPEDDDELASAIAGLCRDAPRRRMLARRALARAGEFAPRVMARRYVASYARAIDRGAPEAIECAS